MEYKFSEEHVIVEKFFCTLGFLQVLAMNEDERKFEISPIRFHIKSPPGFQKKINQL